MWAIVRRAIVSVTLITAGLVSLSYGVMFHRAPVIEEQETQTTIDVPTGFMPGPPGQGASFGMPPAFTKKTVTRIDRITKMESEPTLTREVTVGGIALLDSGELKRTYSGEKGPALCPS